MLLMFLILGWLVYFSIDTKTESLWMSLVRILDFGLHLAFQLFY